MSHAFVNLVELARKKQDEFAAVARDDLVSSARSYIEAEREDIRDRHRRGASGANVVAALTGLADTVVTGAFEFALCTIPQRRGVLERISICALGGYGRAQLNPYSDLDLSILYEGRRSKAIEAIGAFVGPFLWDIGFANSCVMRSVKETIQLLKHDIRVYTSYLECRLLYGGSGPYARLRLKLRALRPGDTPDTFGLVKLRERGESLGEEYRDLYAAEPNVKESAGGLRDYHAALWLLMVTYDAPTLDAAVGHALITSDERIELAEALDMLWRVRNELHFRAQKAEDRLTHENQSAVAKAFEYTDDENPDTSRFLQDYYKAARIIRRFLRKVARMCDFDSSAPALEAPRAVVADITIEDGELYAGLNDPHWFEENPARLMSVFRECARNEVILSLPTEQAIEVNLHLIGDTFRSSDLVRRYFVAICNRPRQAGYALRQMAGTGVLGRYIPEFAAVRDIIRYAEFHSYPVDEHTLRAVEALAGIADMEGPVGRCLQLALENLSDPYILVVALLLHDLGKVFGEKHVEEGAELAGEICPRMGLPKEDEERIVFLVAHHMVMSEVGLYRDTDDMDVVVQFAKTMKTEERLRALFLLTYADMTAVGPNVWNDWKGALLLRLYLRTEKVLLGRAEPLDAEYWKLPKAEEIRGLLPPDQKGLLESHLRELGERYFLAFSSEEIALHIECLQQAYRDGFAMRCVNNDETETSEVVICTRDHRGVFCEIAGCFASQLIDVSSAALFTRGDGMTVDAFTVVSAKQRRPLTKAQVSGVERVLRSVLSGECTVEEQLEQSRRRLFGLLQPPVTVPTRVQFDNESSRTHTVLDVISADRTGLMYEIAKVLTERGYDISTARIVTDARRVRDSFYITDNGAKLEDREIRDELTEALKEAIHPRPTVET